MSDTAALIAAYEASIRQRGAHAGFTPEAIEQEVREMHQLIELVREEARAEAKSECRRNAANGELCDG